MEYKTCPKCLDSPTMKAVPVIGMIPARSGGELSPKVINDACGFPVQVYECPSCHLVELYRQA